MVYHAKNGHQRFDVDILDCSSRLDASSMVKIRQRVNQLVRKNHTKVLLDLTRTRHVDLAGLGILVERLRMVRSLNGDIKLCHLRRTISDMLRLVGVSKLIEAYGSREEAIRSFMCPQ